MDLVMERTKHLSMSPEEKARARREDFEKRLKGLLQQYADGALSIDALQDRITGLQAEWNVTDKQLVVGAVVHRIDPDRANQQWLNLLADFAADICEPLQETLAKYREQKTGLLQTTNERLLARIDQRHGIKGTAVMPNLQKDTQFQEALAALMRDTRTRIEALSRQAV